MNITIRKRANNKYQAIVSYKENGEWKQSPKGGFDKRSDAKDWADEEVFRLTEDLKKGIVRSDMTLGEVFELYIEKSIQEGRAKNTIQHYKNTRDFLEIMLDKEIGKITTTDLRNHFTVKRKETGKSYYEYKYSLNPIFNFAIKELKIIRDNPCSLLKLENTSKDERIKFITKELYEQIIEECDDEIRALFVRVAYETGMRLSEILGIRKEDVKNLRIRVNKQMHNKKNTKAKLKTKSSYRDVPISQDLQDTIRSFAKNEHDRVFKLLSKAQVYNLLAKYGTSTHCFRHTYATNLISNNVDLTVVSKVTGDNIETIMKHYMELNKDKLKDSEDKIRLMFEPKQ